MTTSSNLRILAICLVILSLVFMGGCIDQQVPVSVAGPRGPPGNWSGNVTVNVTPGTIDVNHTFTGLPGTDANVTNVGTNMNARLDFVIPRGNDGAANMTAGPAGATGATGANGTAATIDVNHTFTGSPGSGAVVTNIGTTSDARLDFIIPAGSSGATGSNGTAATADVNNTFTVDNATPASVVNVGDSTNALFDFFIPAGQTGAKGNTGANGSAATVDVNFTFTGQPGTNAQVTNVGTSSDALLDFIIPQGQMNQTPNQTPNMTMNQTMPAASTWYDHNVASPDLPGYFVFNRSVPSDGQGTSTAVATIVGTEYLIRAFATNSGDPGLYALPAGDRIWYTFAKVDTVAAGDTHIKIRLYKRAVNGTETELYNLSTMPLSTSVTEDISTKTTTTDITMDPTDRFVAKYFAVTAATNNPTVTLYYDGTTMLSKATSPIAQGLQGPPGPAGPAGTNGTNQLAYGNASEVLYNIGGNATTSPCMHFDNSTGTFTACFLAGDGTSITNVTSTASAIDFAVKEGGVGSLYKGQAVYISGSTGANALVLKADNTQSGKTRVVGMVTTDLTINSAGKVRRNGELTGVDTRPTNANLNPLGQTWAAGDLLFATTNGGLTNVRPTSGRSVKVAYTIKGSSASDILLAYPMENPVWITDAIGEDVVIRLGDSIGVNKMSIRNYGNTEVANFNSLGVLDMLGNKVANVTTTSGGDAINLTLASDMNTSMRNNISFQYNTKAADVIQDEGINTSMRNNISLNYNTIAADATQDEQINTSMRNNVSQYVIAVNTSMKAYVDAKPGGSSDMSWNLSYLLLDGTRAMTGKLNMSNNQIVNVTDPSYAQDAATKNYVDTLQSRRGGQRITGTVTSASPSPTNVTGLFIPVSANQVGTFEGQLVINNNGFTNGSYIGFWIPSGAAISWTGVIARSATATYTLGNTGNMTSSSLGLKTCTYSTADCRVLIRGTYTNGATAGNIQLMQARVVAPDTVRVTANSYIAWDNWSSATAY